MADNNQHFLNRAYDYLSKVIARPIIKYLLDRALIKEIIIGLALEEQKRFYEELLNDRIKIISSKSDLAEGLEKERDEIKKCCERLKEDKDKIEQFAKQTTQVADELEQFCDRFSRLLENATDTINRYELFRAALSYLSQRSIYVTHDTIITVWKWALYEVDKDIIPTFAEKLDKAVLDKPNHNLNREYAAKRLFNSN